jgi:DNA repair protein RadD
VQAGEYTEKSLSEVYDKADILGDVVKTWQKLTPGRKTIVFGVNVAHIKHLKDQFIQAGISACEINAYQTEEERQEALDGYIKRGTMVLCSVEVATKGFDHPATEVAVLAVATRSIIKWTQTTGRALRTYYGKERATILDLGGNCARLGFPDDFEFLVLDDGKKKKASEAKKKERLPKTCPSCDYIKPVGEKTCPSCGFTPEFKKDVEVEDAELSKIQRKVKAEYTVEQKQSWLAQLNFYAASRGMKQGRTGCYGWSLHAYKEKFGSWPSNCMDWARRDPIGSDVNGYIMHKNIKYANRREAGHVH